MLFAFLDESQLKKLVYAMFQREHTQGDVSIKQGDEGDNFYLIEEGSCEVFIQKAVGEPEVKVITCTPQDHNSFGELALINNEPRAATVKCLTDCSFAVLEQKNYLKIIKKVQVAKNNVNVDFFHEIPFFKHLNQNQLRKMMMSFSEKVYAIKQAVYNQGTPSNNVYIIKEGKF